MKTMTCKQLGGPCEQEFHADTFDEMIELCQKHGVELAEKGDESHIRVMEEMREGMKDPEAMRVWVEKLRKVFDELPDD